MLECTKYPKSLFEPSGVSADPEKNLNYSRYMKSKVNVI